MRRKNQLFLTVFYNNNACEKSLRTSLGIGAEFIWP